MLRQELRRRDSLLDQFQLEKLLLQAKKPPGTAKGNSVHFQEVSDIISEEESLRSAKKTLTASSRHSIAAKECSAALIEHQAKVQVAQLPNSAKLQETVLSERAIENVPESSAKQLAFKHLLNVPIPNDFTAMQSVKGQFATFEERARGSLPEQQQTQLFTQESPRLPEEPSGLNQKYLAQAHMQPSVNVKPSEEVVEENEESSQMCGLTSLSD